MSKQQGGNIIKDLGKAIKKADKFLKKTKVISKVSGALGSVGVPYAGAVSNVSGKLGYGKRGGARKKRKRVIKA